MMRNGKGHLFGVLIVIVSIFLFSCAIVTVNVYFPAEEVRSAYESLEEEFLKPSPPEEEKKPEPQKPEGKGEGRINKEKPLHLAKTKQPLVIRIERKISLSFASVARAQGGLAERITQEIKKMPDVVDAYRRRGGRNSLIEEMLEQGKVGEGKDGLLQIRGSLNQSEEGTVDAENGDRQIIISGMARAILRINNLPEDEGNINRVSPQAGEQFAAVQKEKASPGWWIQMPDGEWVKK